MGWRATAPVQPLLVYEYKYVRIDMTIGSGKYNMLLIEKMINLVGLLRSLRKLKVESWLHGSAKKKKKKEEAEEATTGSKSLLV